MKGQISLEFVIVLSIILSSVLFLSKLEFYEPPGKIEEERAALFMDSLFVLGAPFKTPFSLDFEFSPHKLGSSYIVSKEIKRGEKIEYETYPSVRPDNS